MRSRLLLVAVVLLAGCGSGTPRGDGRDGRALFAGTCGNCHTLSAAGTSGTFGPDLDQLNPTAARVARAIAAGPGSMPNGLLQGAQADAVASYVASTAGR